MPRLKSRFKTRVLTSKTIRLSRRITRQHRSSRSAITVSPTILSASTTSTTGLSAISIIPINSHSDTSYATIGAGVLAEYSLHTINDILEKHNREAGERARWLHNANTAVYGENYEKRNVNVAAYFFNEMEPNWYLDASLLQYPSREANDPRFVEWAEQWQHLGTEALIALWLLKTDQHAYNLRDSIIIEFPYLKMETTQSPHLCNMRSATTEVFREAIKQLSGAHVNITL